MHKNEKGVEIKHDIHETSADGAVSVAAEPPVVDACGKAVDLIVSNLTLSVD